MVQYSDTGGGSMSYTAKVYYVLESDVSYTLKYITPSDGSITVGDSFVLQMSDFDYNNKHYYVKYAINNGDVYLRGKDGSIIANTMVISEDGNFANWFVFCTEDESEITGDSIVSMEDIASEVFLTIDGSTLSTQGSEYINSIDIMQGCVSDSFASYGSTYSPTINCDMFSCDFTDALISKAYVNDVIHCTLIRAWMVIKGHEYNPIPIGRFAVKENPTYNGETVSFTGNGLMSEYMDIAEIEISTINKYHKEELENKYVKTGNMDFISYDSDSYFWEFLPEDFLRVTGMPLHIDNWSDILIAIGTYGLQQLMIPVIASSTYDDNTNTYDTEYNSRITWRELLSGIAVLLRGNVIEKNGAFYIKRLPEVKQDGYRPIFDNSMYDSSAIFGNNLMSPSKISVKANNWLPYMSKDKNPIGFGYCDGESTVVLNDSVSSIHNVENYPVTIECPWILFETLNRNTNQSHDWYPFIGNNRAMNWQTGLKSLNRAFVYHKASFETMAWHPLMNVGDIIIVEDHDGVKRYVFVGEMTLHYNGTVYAEITSPCEVQETNTSSVGGGGSTSYNSGTTAQASGTAMGTMLGAIFKDGVITNSKIADSTITGSKIAESTIENSNIKDSAITGSKFVDGTIENSKIKDSTLTGAKIADATIGFEKVNTSFIKDLTADKAYIDNLTARIGDFGFITSDSADLKYATITSLQAVDGKIDTLTAKAITTDNLEAEVATLGYLSAESADVKFATIESLTAVDGKIDTLSSKAITTENLSAKVADLGYLSAESAEIGYAKIDFSNVGTQVVSSSMIIDGAVTNEKVANLSANKITSGTIDASKITVTNLNADNLTVGTINGKLIGNGSVDLDKLSQEVPTKEYLDNVQKELQGQIDGAIETFTKSEIPTLNNEPANAWTDNETRKKHIGDVCYVLNPASSADGYCYRFANTGTEASPSYEWVLIKDSDVTKALQDIIDINKDITGIKKFDEEISSWKKDTGEELSSLKLRTSTLETDMGSKVESSVFNEVKQTVDENSASIMSLSDTVSKKADGSTVETLTNTVNEVKQTADSNSLSISGMQTEIGKKADGSTVTELSIKTSKLEQNLDGFKTEVSNTYTTKTEFDNLEIGGRNLWAWTNASAGYEYIGGVNGTLPHCTMRKHISVTPGEVLCYQIWNPSLINDTGNYTRIAWYDSSDTYISSVELPKLDGQKYHTQLYTAPSNAYYAMLGTMIGPGETMENTSTKTKWERGNKATDWSPAPEDTEESITEVKTIAEQTAEKFSWLVKSGTSATNFELTDRTANLVANHINLNGLVTFSGLGSDAQSKINNAENAANTANSNVSTALSTANSANATANSASSTANSALSTANTANSNASSAISTANNANSNASTALNTVSNIEIGGRNLISNIASNWQQGHWSDVDGNYINYNGRICTKVGLKVSPGETYALKIYLNGVTDKYLLFRMYGSDGSFIDSVTGITNSIYTVPSNVYELRFALYENVTLDDLTNGAVRVKVEKGNKATDWTPAPEDISVENIYTPNTTTIDGGKITTGSIKAEKINVSDLFAQTVTATNLTVSGNSKLAGWSVSGNKIVSNEFSDNSYSGGIEKATMSIDSDKGIATSCTANGNNVDCLFNGARWIASLSEYEGFEILLDGESVSCRRDTVVSGVPVPIEMVTISPNGLDVVNGTLKTQSINGTELAVDGIASTSEYGVTKKRTYKCLYISSPTSATSISSIVQGDYNEMIVEVETYQGDMFAAYQVSVPIDAVSSLTSYKSWLSGYSAGTTYYGLAEIRIKKDYIYLSQVYKGGVDLTNDSNTHMRVYYC